MALTIGIIGLPNIGKSTLFNALTSRQAEASNYPFCTVEPNVGIVQVPDLRLQALNSKMKPASCIPTTIRFVDIAGLIRGASSGEGLGNQFLAHVREADVLCHVVRGFRDDEIVHVNGSVDVLADVTTVNTELLLADLELAMAIQPKLAKVIQSEPRSGRAAELGIINRIIDALGQGQMIGELGLSVVEEQVVSGYAFLTVKPQLYLVNVGEEDAAGGGEAESILAAQVGDAEVVAVSAQIESEIAQLGPAEAREFLYALNLQETGRDRLITAGFRLLNLITFYTVANDILQAWQLPAGSMAPTAAGLIHSDMESGFIRAEVASYADVESAEGIADLRKAGRLRIEGRDYIVADGDVINFLFKSG